jgi:hypothetical protein
LVIASGEHFALTYGNSTEREKKRDKKGKDKQSNQEEHKGIDTIKV